MAKLLVFFVSCCCLVSIGCQDERGDAIKRLATEQKKLDVIDNAIKAIKAEEEEEEKKSETTDSRAVKFTDSLQYDGSNRQSDEHKEALSRAMERSIRTAEFTNGPSLFWSQKRTEQLRIVEEAKKAVAEAK